MLDWTPPYIRNEVADSGASACSCRLQGQLVADGTPMAGAGGQSPYEPDSLQHATPCEHSVACKEHAPCPGASRHGHAGWSEQRSRDKEGRPEPGLPPDDAQLRPPHLLVHVARLRARKRHGSAVAGCSSECDATTQLFETLIGTRSTLHNLQSSRMPD